MLSSKVRISENNTKQGVVGGYCSWNDIKKPSNNDDITSLTDYFKNQLTSKHLEVIKSLLLIPFHNILRNDQIYVKGNSAICSNMWNTICI